MIECLVCKTKFFVWEERENLTNYETHLSYCNAKATAARLKKSTKKRPPEMALEGWEDFT